MRQLVFRNALGNSLTLYRDPNLITKIDGIEMPAVDMQTQSAPYQDGVTDLDALFGPRTIVCEGSFLVSGLSAVYASRASMTAQLNPKLGLGTLTFTNDIGAYTTSCRCISAVLPNKDYTNPFQNFQLQFFCPDPYWYDINQSSILLSYVSGGKTFPFTFPVVFGNYTGVVPQVALNLGDSVSPVVMSITGPATNPIVQNLTTGQLMKINIILNNNDVLNINTKFGSKSVILNRGGVISNQSSCIDANSTFWSLDIGANTIQFTNDLTYAMPTCTVSWYNRYSGK